MSRKRITRVELEKFRGATTSTYIDFDSSKPIVVIFGENGSGKSTIGNAIDFVCNRSIGSLESMSGADHKSLVSVGCSDTELRVVIHQDTKSWQGTKKGKTITVRPNTGHPRVETLRRKKILQFIEAQPKDRYEQIKGFLDFDNIQTSEDKLNDAARRSKQSLERYLELRAQAESLLDQHWKSQGSPGSSAEEWAEDKLKQDLSKTRTRIGLLATAIAKIENLKAAHTKFLEAGVEHAGAMSALDKVKKEIEAASGSGSQANMELVDLLNRMKVIIADPYSANECPACLSQYELPKLRIEVEGRIESLRTADALSKKSAAAERLLESKRTLLERADNVLREALASCKTSLNNVVDDSVEFRTQYSQLPTAFDGIEADESKITGLLTALETAKEKFAAVNESLSRDVALYDAIKQQLELFRANVEQVEVENRIKMGLEAALEIVRTSRKAHTIAILDKVHDEVVRLWEKIHPDEPIKPTRFELKEETKGSLNQYASFGDVENIPPQAYFSESHLDTLGFCYWLAITKYATDGDAILVLDDVFTSVDNVHIQRVMDLLNEECETFNQIIITTHQRRWHDAYRYGTRSRNKAVVLELGLWDKNNGIVSLSSQMESERLRTLIDASPFDRQATCAKAGVLLEQMFDELTKHYRCSMPRGHRNEYTLGDYVNGSKSLFKKLKVKRPISETEFEEVGFEKFYDDLVAFVTVRNLLGAHFNFKAEDYTDAEALELATLVHRCVDSLICQICFGIATKEDKATGEWACECKRTRMFPKAL
ncbi:MAG: AAA family ATPase [Pyrinomonadaceae bacterium]|nr:AAA family ATPase [Pyrinomonadaceae bacterium]